MHAPGPGARGWEAVSGACRLLAAPRPRGTQRPAPSLGARRPPGARGSLSLGFPGQPVPLLGCLSPCPGGGAVGQASCQLRRRRGCPGRGERGTRDCPPSLLRPPSAFGAPWRVGAGPTPRRLLPGTGGLGRPEAVEPEGRSQGGRPPHFLRLPGGGAISARWAPKSRELGARRRRTRRA